jgi:hypothetical protein
MPVTKKLVYKLKGAESGLNGTALRLWGHKAMGVRSFILHYLVFIRNKMGIQAFF